jgi:hypothetical protein
MCSQLPSLSQFQSALTDALQGDVDAMMPWLARSLEDTPGLAVYRNTVLRGTVDVLVATFSTVVRMVGDDWFRAAAAIYVAAPRQLVCESGAPWIVSQRVVFES